MNQKQLEDKFGDIFYSLILLADSFQIELAKALQDTTVRNEKKYPINEFGNPNKKKQRRIVITKFYAELLLPKHNRQIPHFKQ